MPRIPLSVGQLVDRLIKLELKQRSLTGVALEYVNREHALLKQEFQSLGQSVPADLQQLQELNGQLWQVENAICDCDQRADFGPALVALAQRVYRLNDRRAASKRAFNLASGSSLIEEKCFGSCA